LKRRSFFVVENLEGTRTFGVRKWMCEGEAEKDERVLKV